MVSLLVRRRAHSELYEAGNPRVARQMEAAHRTALAKAEVGIKPKRPKVTLAEFVPRAMEEIRKNCVQHPRTAEFYDVVRHSTGDYPSPAMQLLASWWTLDFESVNAAL